MGDAYDDYEQRQLWRHIKNDFHKPIRRQRVLWTMANGKKIYIDEMEDSHLHNCANLVRRRSGDCRLLDLINEEIKRRN
jgi:hypothetical protein